MSSANEDINPDSGKSNAAYKALTIGGVPILFPFRPYPCQVTIMSKIVKALNKQENGLFESPTGSGKSLALLCACLAWQKKIKKAIQEYEEKLEMELNTCGVNIPDQYAVRTSNSESNISGNVDLDDSTKNPDLPCCSKMSISKEEIIERYNKRSKESTKGKRGIIYIDDSEDFKPVKKFRCSNGPMILPSENDEEKSSVNQDCNATCSEENPEVLPCKLDTSDSSILTQGNVADTKGKCTEGQNTVPTKLPKIYYGTRTHKQIDQVIQELKKTPYKNSNMTILSSRDRSCIHPQASRADNKNEACSELLKNKYGPSCRFFRNSKTISHCYPGQLSTAFDLEDFVGLCKKVQACPYYGSRELLSTSDIVFCPYNYLVDPLIRSALNINLKGSIVIMDEAHNIEDSARDAASASFSLAVLEESVTDLERVGRESQTSPVCYKFMARILSNMADWLKSNVNNLTDYVSYDSSAKVFQMDDLLAVLCFLEIGPDSFSDFQKQFEKILAEEKDSDTEKEDDIDGPKLAGTTVMCLKNLSQTLIYLYKNEQVFVRDYRLVIVKYNSSAYSRKKSQASSDLTLNFWCMNPAVAFSDIKGITHSVIVASGTLAPLSSFSSELGMSFPVDHEAKHVVPSDQMWVGTISKGPNNCSLNANYQNASTFTFQDDIGHIVLQVSCIIPHGVLCFLPSYGMLDNLVKRWQQTGLWDKLLTKKLVLSEPRKQRDLAPVINEFYESVKQSESSIEGTRNGALFLAVCRGKVSEGLDFADNNARAVITVGIPFPNLKNAQVDLKKKYNDLHRSLGGIQRGGDWYDAQAFRALNQALGRCIRHRNDFGALIIVDERFQMISRYPGALSRWIKEEIKHFPKFSDAMNSLSCFADRTGLKTILSEEE